jgi:serpin B
MKSLKLIVAIILVFAFNSCSKDYSPLAPNTQERQYQTLPVTHLQNEVIQSNNTFSFQLFSQLNAINPGQNVFISPFSVSMALGMALNGANGETYSAVQNTLGFSGMEEQTINQTYGYLYRALQQLDPSVELEIANSVWCKKDVDLLPEFLSVNKTYFDAEVRTLNFADPQAVLTINQWIAHATHDKIKNVLRSISPQAVLYLINALYFHGIWQHEFPEKATRKQDFYLLDGSKTPCDMMTVKLKTPVYPDNNIEAVELPYGQGNFVMTLIMPKNPDKFNDYVLHFNRDVWQQIKQALRPRQCIIGLPKLRFRFKSTLNAPLAKLGMGIAFSDRADFSRISSDQNLKISRLIHQTFVEVNEKGTEAAAVTVSEVVSTSIHDPILTLTFDHPYLFVISEKSTDTILFMGKVLKPVWN